MNLLNQFKSYLFSQKYQPSNVTVKNYLSDINHFLRFFENEYQKPFSPAELNFAVITNYRTQSLNSLSQASVDRHISSLRKFCAFLKLDGQISTDPFEMANIKAKPEADPWHLREFKNYLYVFNASHLTIKNYIIDVRQFLTWAEEVTASSTAGAFEDTDVLAKINQKLVEEYKQRLISEGDFSPSSINRKLSSLRKYLQWMEDEGLVKNEAYVPNVELQKSAEIITSETKAQVENKKEFSYSPFPPFRLFQKLGIGFVFILDKTLIGFTANKLAKLDYLLWKIKGKPIFKAKPIAGITKSLSSHNLLRISNIKKEFYAPFDISTKSFPLYKKVLFTARYYRPQWYKTYHSYPIVHYFHFAVLIIFMAGIGFGFYNTFFQRGNQSPTLAAAPVAPPRILSFQGRLTDSSDSPIVAPTWLRFTIYDAQAPASASSDLLWQEEDMVSPDIDGIFNVLLGNTAVNCSNPLTPATGACLIPQALFASNSALFLGITVSNTPELTPRQQLATVAYASNAETLQGMAPITQTGAGAKNVVLALDSNGNLTIGSALITASPVIQAANGALTLTGQPLILTTNSGSNSNTYLSADGWGKIAMNKPLTSGSQSNNIPTAVGSVEVDSLFSVLATSSGQSAVTINQTGGGPLISASASGVSKFTVDNSGNIIVAGTTGFGTKTYTWPVTALTANYVLSTTDTNGTLGWVAQGTNFWQELTGATSLINTKSDLLIGGSSTASAVFAFTGLSTPLHQTQASISGNLIVMPNNGFGGTVGIGTTAATLAMLQVSVPASITTPIQDLANFSNLPGQEPTADQVNALQLNWYVKPAAGNADYSLRDVVTNNNTATGGTAGGMRIVATGVGASINSPTVGLSIDGLANASKGTLLQNAIQIGANWDSSIFGMGDLRINANGNIILATSSANTKVAINTTAPLATLDVRANTLNLAAASFSASMNFASLIANNDGTGDIFTASSSGWTRFVINRFGAIGLTGTGGAGSPSYGSAGNCLLSGGLGATSTWGTCGSGVNFWQELTGATSLINTKSDLLIGGSSTASAVFAFTGLSTPLHQTQASISGNLIVMPNNGFGGTVGIGTTTPTAALDVVGVSPAAGNAPLAFSVLGGTGANSSIGGGISLTSGPGGTKSSGVAGAGGNLSLASGTGGAQSGLGGGGPGGSLTLTGGNGGTSATGVGGAGGNITLNPGAGGIAVLNNGTDGNIILANLRGNVGINTTAPLATLDVRANTLNLAAASFSASMNFASLIANNDGTGDIFTASSSGWTRFVINRFGAIGLTGTGGAGSPSYGSAGNCLLSGGLGATSTWGTCGSGVNFWQELTGALSPVKAGDDLLLGSSSTSSAKFAFTGLMGVNPQASFSGNFVVMPYTSGATENGGNVGIGITTPLATLSVAGTGLFQSPVASSAAFQVQNTYGAPVFLVDTTNSTNLLSNPGFEVGLSGWSLQTGSTLVRNISKGYVYHGQSSLLIKTSTSNYSGASTNSFTTGATLGTGTYTLSFYAMLQNGTLTTLNAGYNQGAGNVVCTLNNNTVKTNGFQRYYCTFTIASGTLNSVYIDQGTGTTALNLYIDSVQLQNSSSVTPYQIGSIQLRGLINAPVAIQPTADSVSVFQIQNAAGTNNLFLADTMNNAIGIGTNNALATLDVRGLTNTTAAASISGQTTFAALVVNNNGTGDLFTASSSGWTRFSIRQNGAIGLSGPNGPTYGSAGNCLLSGGLGATSTWGSCGSSTGYNFWQELTGALSPVKAGDDLLLGGSSTASAVFAFTGLMGTTTQASMSGQFILTPNKGYGGSASVSGALTLGSYGLAGAIQTTANQLLTIGGNTTGNIKFMPGNSSSSLYLASNGSVGINTATPAATLDVAGTASIGGQLTFRSTFGAIQTTADQTLTLGGNSTGKIQLLPFGGPTVAVGNTGGIVFGGYNTCTLKTDASGYVQCQTDLTTAGSPNFWQELTGALSPVKAGDDLLLGGSSTASAVFAFTGMQLPTHQTQASMSGNLIVMPNYGYGGKVGIDTMTPLAVLDVRSLTSLSGPVASISGTTYFPLLSLYNGSNNTTSDLIIASSSSVITNAFGGTQFKVTNGGAVYGRSFTDLDNSSYYLDPAASLSLVTAGTASIGGNLTFTNNTTNNVYMLNNSSLNFLHSAGGTGSTTSTLYLANNGFVGIGTATPNAFLSIKGTIDSASLGIELVTNGTFTGSAGSWTPLGTGWAYNSNNVTHTAGSAGNLSQAITLVAGTFYQVVFDVTGITQGSVTPILGGSYGMEVWGNSTTETQIIYAPSTGSIVFAADANFNGTIDNVSVKKVTTVNPLATILNSDGSTALEIRSGGTGNANTFIGYHAGITNQGSTSNNTGIGYAALSSITTGAQNTALGTNALTNNTTASQNNAFGFDALYSNTTGSANNAFGTTALTNNTTGSNNTALGHQSLYNNTTGFDNVAFGDGALYSNTTGYQNAAFGYGADVASGNLNNANAIGNYAYASQSNSLILGSINGQNGASADTNVGIGLTNPSYRLDVNGVTNSSGFQGNGGASGYSSFYAHNGNSGYAAFLSYTAAEAYPNVKIPGWAGIGFGPGSSDTDVWLRRSTTNTLYIDSNGSGGAANLSVTGNVVITGTCTSQGSDCAVDLAEFYPASEPIEKGEIVVADSNNKETVKKSTSTYQHGIIGISSTAPGFLLSDTGAKVGNNQAYDPLKPNIALAGRTPVKVSAENGPIAIGDVLTTSSIPGVAMKATKAGQIVGKALESFNGQQCNNGTIEECKILVFVNVSWYDPQVYLTSTGDLNLVDQNATDANFTVPHYFTLNDALGNPVDRVGAFAELAVANLRAGGINAQQIATQALNVATENITIKGQNIRDYIAGVVFDELAKLNTSEIISPISSTDTISTNLISPLDNSRISLKVNDNKLSILNGNSASASAVAIIDNQGNASFSGQLSSNSLTTNEATISGTLHVGKLVVDEVVGATASSNITNNYYISSNSASSDFGLISSQATPATNSSSEIFQQLGSLAAGHYMDVSSYSGQLTYVQNLSAANAAFTQGLMVFGSTSLSDTSIVGQLSVNGSLILANNSINVLGSDLNLQPLRQGGISIMAGLVTIDANGNAVFSQDLTVKGTLYANVLSPVPGNDLIARLGNDQTQLQTKKPQLAIENSSGSAVLSINQLGDLIASGAGTFTKLNLNPVQEAYAVSPTEIVASGSAGTAFINAYQKQITIDDTLVTDKSLIYITPTSNTNNQVLYLLRQVPGVSFTVGIQNTLNTGIPFNWIIVN